MTRALLAAAAVTFAVLVAWPQRALTHGSITTTVLFDREIVRVLNDHCVMCHMERGLAFPLETYEQTWARGQAIRTEVLQRHMPPWAAVAGYGSFRNANRLTLRESQFVISWVEGLGPRNAGRVFLNVANASGPATAVRAQAHVGHWHLGEPDLAVPLMPTTIAARQADFVRSVIIDPALRAPRSIRAIEFMPGDRRVLRAAVFTVEQTGQWLGSWTPWYGFVAAPDGAAFRLAAGARVIAQLHYRGSVESVVDRGTLGLYFAPGVARPISDLALNAGATDSGGTRRARARVTEATQVWALQPQISQGQTSLEVTARMPDGSTSILLWARNPATEWPTPYLLDRPVQLPLGSELIAIARYGGAVPASPALVTLSRY